jgi:pimeloyl-ACP methyl ester carboxylesterase
MNRLSTRRHGTWRWRGALAMAVLCALCLGTVPATAASNSDAPVCRGVSIPVTLALLVPGTVHGTLCRPAGTLARPGEIQLLVAGATYQSSYWDGEGVAAASYVAVATAAGATTLAIDRIGTGASSPALSALVTATTEASIIHEVITALRQGSVDGQRHDQVALIGHSLGSMEGLVEASTYRDVAELVLTGYTHLISVTTVVSIFLSGLRPADQEGFPDRDPGWLATIPGTRESLFDATADVDPAVVAADEAHRDVVSAATLPDAIAGSLDPLVSAALTMPVLEVDGGQDRIFCGPLTAGCPTAAALYTREGPSFPHTSLATVVLPSAGHDVSLARDGDLAATAIQSWLAAASAGHAASGPQPAGG